MALQYYFNKGEKRTTFIAFENGFHGDTFGAMSVSGLSVYNGPFKDFLIKIERSPTPNRSNHKAILNTIEAITETQEVAGFIYEPLIQGAAGMKIHDPKGLKSILSFFKGKGILNIADEVMTGFGKTGKHFASDYIETKPDIICLSKALTAGLIPMAITSCTQDIYNGFLSDDISKGFFHCHTYSANPVACSAAIAGIALLVSDEIQESIQKISESHINFSKQIKHHPKVKAVRQLGVIFALDLNTKMQRYGDLRDKLLKFFMDRGVFLRPLGSTIYVQTPYTITQKQLDKIYKTIEQALEIV
jgi:adenosylmethionine-8-amino-7-oxononanoate aminotransferase